MNTEFNEQSAANAEQDGENDNYVYKNVLQDKQHRRTWSVVSLALSILSILLVYFSWVGLILSVAAIACAAVSRKNIGYFDKLSLFGLIIGIFGTVFSLSGIIFVDLIKSFFAF